MKKNTPVSKIMSTDIISVSVHQKPSEVRRLMTEQNIHHVPVVSGDNLVGLLSSSDLLKLSFAAFGADERSIDSIIDHQFKIEEVMSKNLKTVSPKDSIRDATELLAEGTFHSLPVTEDGKLVGILTSTDLLRYLLSQF